MYNILKTLNIKIKMVSDIFHNVEVMIDPREKYPVVVFLAQNFGVGAQGKGKGREMYHFRPPPCIFMIF